MLALARELIRKEPLLLRLESPAVTVPHVRSNLPVLHGLMQAFASLWPMANSTNVVFLGNFVDPDQPDAADTVVYLLCLKVLTPQRIHLLRGPLESCGAQLARSPLERQFKQLYGDEACSLLREIVDQLPFAAIVDQRVFLTSSGIPFTAAANRRTSQIEDLNPLDKVPIGKVTSLYLNRILKGQPKSQLRGPICSKSKVAKVPKRAWKNKTLIKVKRSATRANLRKSSKTVASPMSSLPACAPLLNFTRATLAHFLHANQLSHVIRSEELGPSTSKPYKVESRGALVTLGGIERVQPQQPPSVTGGKQQQPGAVALIDQGKIRLIRCV